MAVSPCCLKAFEWDGTPSGHEGTLANRNSYITGQNPHVAVLIIHDIFGWTFSNVRLLADHYAREASVTVYVPDFFGGEVLPQEPLLAGRLHELDLDTFLLNNSREVREPEIFDCAKVLRQRHKKVAAVGFCFGGWACFRLGAREHAVNGSPLVDCISVGHPSFLTEKDIDEIAVPVQVLAPELDPMYTAELKMYTLKTLPKLNLSWDYQYFPGLEHGALTRGDPNKPGERDGMARAKEAVVSWLKVLVQG
ncbi:dienelactone hydrolase family protein [Colletotrichum truncatum]|uniref:Dienelactone hydrolase family protein n=1 Tax=Colletotrichum truncatum TaxID=5467 RepID=A0ACC3YWG8_COLTU|nr:dienelactone hydrolase family protein [Colletotrichum truncatum]KAF6798685.1 dienelactone hydrolase family protein [Colletotrichum truncatum]